ncbi:MAG TPA: CBS domain-containing protein [Anaerolineae bacterium]|nr:CBS domain-containing protein [Anaerolineae bacterium]
MNVHEIMTIDVVSVKRDTPVNEIAKLMGARDISGVPVVDDAGHVVGVVTELDLIQRNTRLDMPHFLQILDLGRIPLELPSQYRHRMQHMLGARAEDVMSHEVITIGPDDSVERLAELLVNRRVNPVPVVAEGRLVGIVSRADLIDMMAAEMGAPPTGTSESAS